jgi:hypothetical protein
VRRRADGPGTPGWVRAVEGVTGLFTFYVTFGLPLWPLTVSHFLFGSISAASLGLAIGGIDGRRRPGVAWMVAAGSIVIGCVAATNVLSDPARWQAGPALVYSLGLLLVPALLQPLVLARLVRRPLAGSAVRWEADALLD